MSDTSSPKRPRLEFDDSSGKDEHFDKYKSREREREQDDQSSSYSHSHSKHRKRPEPEEDEAKDEDGKTKLSSAENARREHTLVMRLTNKEQELQDCMNQIQEMKQAQTQNTAQLRSMLLDPAINLVFQRMAKEMDDHKDKLKQKQNELTAWKFTPDSQTGMRVMARCRMLLQENQELGKMISSGRTARLEGEIVLHKALATEMKKNQKELDEFVGELEEDVEGMQGMIFMLRQQLKEAQEQITRLQAENEQLRTLSIPSDLEPGGSSVANSSSITPVRSWGLDDHSSGASPSTPLQSLVNVQDKTPQKRTAASDSDTVSEVQSPGVETTAQSSLSLAAQTYEDFKPGVFTSKVTPDSGIHTQEEEEDVSVDASDFAQVASSLDSNKPLQICDRLKPANETVSSATKSSSDSIFPTEEQQAIAEKGNSLPTQPDLSAQSPHSKSDTQADNENTRTTPTSALVAASNSSDLSNHHSLPISTETSSVEARTCDKAENQAAIDTSLEKDTSTQGSNNAANIPESADLTESPSSPNGDAAINRTASQQRTIQDENKSELHASLGLEINPKVEDEKVECQTTLGLVNGNAKLHT
ncbi:hypothetical protein EGW08_008437 [Elysia chlorotica]|uniref:Pre-mRNA-splicing regulator WTAP n=1 Tax=Elysia chlorotica TaxID=188477 RepID=A0A3S1A686_ELYCH|nr:hypothetical protein EGW08_008437 [Elysia chlorotica]